MIVPIGEWVLRQACAAASQWPGGLKVAVNLSAVQFKSRNLVAATVAACRRIWFAPDRLELEITETVMMHDTDTTLATLHQFQELGIHIAMDDFGTGYSSLSYLRRFPLTGSRSTNRSSANWASGQIAWRLSARWPRLAVARYGDHSRGRRDSRNNSTRWSGRAAPKSKVICSARRSPAAR